MASCRSPSAPLDMNLAIPVFQYYLKFPGKKIKKSFEIGIFMLCTDFPPLPPPFLSGQILDALR